MVITDAHTLPTEEELTVQDVNISTQYLKAGAFHYGVYCDLPNREFMLCRKEMRDPRACLNEGKDVTKCGLKFFRLVKKNCLQEFNDYAKCLDWSSENLRYSLCRKTQHAFDDCMLEKLDIKRPELGWFATPKIHNSTRPKVERHFKKYTEDLPDELPKDFEKKTPISSGTYFY